MAGIVDSHFYINSTLKFFHVCVLLREWYIDQNCLGVRQRGFEESILGLLNHGNCQVPECAELAVN